MDFTQWLVKQVLQNEYTTLQIQLQIQYFFLILKIQWKHLLSKIHIMNT